MQDELVAGIKNAMERGESLEQAIQSFINAGYNPAEVRAAGSMLSDGASKIAYTEQPIAPEIRKPLPVFPERNSDSPVQKGASAQQRGVPLKIQKKSKKKVLILIAILMALIIFVAGLVYFILNL
jgi:hypothetical protein